MKHSLIFCKNCFICLFVASRIMFLLWNLSNVFAQNMFRLILLGDLINKNVP